MNGVQSTAWNKQHLNRPRFAYGSLDQFEDGFFENIIKMHETLTYPKKTTLLTIKMERFGCPVVYAPSANSKYPTRSFDYLDQLGLRSTRPTQHSIPNKHCYCKASAMAAAGTMHSRQNAKVSFGVYKPQEGSHIDDVVAQMVRAAASIEKCMENISITILRSINGKWVCNLLFVYYVLYSFIPHDNIYN